MKDKIKMNKKTKKILLVSALLLVVLGIGLFIYQRRSADKTAGIGTPGQTDYINLEPATEEDKKRAETNKERLIERQEQEQSQDPQPAGTKKIVKPTITYAGQYGETVEVGAFVGSIFEDGGSCTTSFSRGDIKFSKSVQAIKNVSTVDCPTMSAPTSEFSQKGTWSITVNYSSGSAEGTSDTKQIEVK